MKILLILLGVLTVSSAWASESVAVFAGGSFLDMAHDFQGLAGVRSVVVGYTGAQLMRRDQHIVSAGQAPFYEAVEVTYDPDQLSYAALAAFFWRHIDLFDDEGQFCQRGAVYKAAIFHLNYEERDQALAGKRRLEQFFGRSVVTDILPRVSFWPAQASLQQYSLKHPLAYKLKRKVCGRDAALRALWASR